MSSEAILSNDGQFTSFSFNNQTIRFATSSKLEKYTQIIEWKYGFIVVMAVYQGIGEVEEYIDLVPILENLYMDPDNFLSPIQKVRIAYD